MAATPISKTKYTSQYIDNMSFDDALKTKVTQVVDHAGNFVSPATEETLKALQGFQIPVHDHLALTVATTTDTWVYKTGGAAGTTVATVLITYTDSGKGTITTIAKS